MDAIVGRVFENRTEGERGLDGFWKVTVIVMEKVTFNGVDWEKEEVSAVGMDRTWDEANKTALRSVLQYLDEYVYSRGFDSLVLAVKAQKAGNDGGAEANTN